MGFPDFLTINTFILILGIGQIHHNLRQGTGHGFDPENLILLKAGGKHQLYIPLLFPAPGHRQGEQAAQEKQNPFFTVFHTSIVLKILLATLIPLAEACCSPLVTPAPSPIARSPQMLVSKS